MARFGGLVGIDPGLLEILRCPACYGVLRLVDGDLGLDCSSCRRRYPIEDGTPVMLVEDATPPAP